MSTINAPGTRASFMRASASAAARRNWAPLFVMSIPYAISMIRDANKLAQGVKDEIYDNVIRRNAHNSV